jgi:hypothetical protein
MPFKESVPKAAHIPPPLELGQQVFDKEGKRVGKIEARFSHHILVQRGGLFVKAYYVPHSAISREDEHGLHLSLSEDELRDKGFNRVPDDLYIESPELGVTDLSGVAQFARGPLSPAQTGHYNYGRHSPGINTDASGSYHRDEVMPKPQQYVGESTTIFTTDEPIEP